MWSHTSCHCAVGGRSTPNLNQLFSAAVFFFFFFFFLWWSHVWPTAIEEVWTSVLLICEASPPPTPFPFPSEHATLEDVAQMSGLGSKSNAPQRAGGIARCPPSVCMTCQMPCHHHHHQSKLHQSVCACVCLHTTVGQTCMISLQVFWQVTPMR